jgi:hypothetical protein
VFGRIDLMQDGATADAVVVSSDWHKGQAGLRDLGSPGTYHLRLVVRFPDGTTAEISRAIGDTFIQSALGAAAPIDGARIPVRYDPDHRDRVEIDRLALKAHAASLGRSEKAAEDTRAQQLLAGADLGGPATAAEQPLPADLRAPGRPLIALSGGEQAGALRISDADRDQISEVLSQHAAEGRLTTDELDQRVDALYAARTRAEAAAVVADLPTLVSVPPPHHFHLGHEPERETPSLPEWLTPNWQLDSVRPEPRFSPTVASPPTASPTPTSQDRAAMRKRAKLRQDENAIGHTFKATRRAINAELERAAAAGQSEEVQGLNDRLREAQNAAESARQAVAAGDRAEAQRFLARLRTLAPDPR